MKTKGKQMGKSKQIAALISSFPTQNNLEPEAAMAGYEIAVSDYSDEIVTRAVVGFLRNEVSGHDGRWLPTPAQLAGQCSKLMEPQRMMDRSRRIAERSLHALEAPKGPSNERRAEIVNEVMEKHNAWYDDFKSEKKPQQHFTPVTADTLGDPRPLAERLNIRDVAPAQYDVPETRVASKFKTLDPQLPTQKVAAE